MRYVFGLLGLVMLAFAAVQYNDADGLLWAFFYAVPAIWAGIAALRPALLARPAARGILGICLAGAVALTIWLWPPAPGWWQQDVWGMGKPDPRASYIAELAREGMGLMIATAVLLAVLVRSLTAGTSRAPEASGSVAQSP